MDERSPRDLPGASFVPSDELVLLVLDLDRAPVVLHAELPLRLLDRVVANGLERGRRDLTEVGEVTGALAVDDEGRCGCGARRPAIGLQIVRLRRAGAEELR